MAEFKGITGITMIFGKEILELFLFAPK